VLRRIGLTVLLAAAVGLILGNHPRPQELLAPPEYSPAGPHDHNTMRLHTDGRRVRS
jgi:hypothetical protein